MSTSNAEMYKNIIGCHSNLMAGNVLSLAHIEALNYMRDAAVDKLTTENSLINDINNDTIVKILNQHFLGTGVKFVKPDGNVLPTVRIKVANTKYVKDDSMISLTNEFYIELADVLSKYKISGVQWNNNRTSFWWNSNEK